jgi:hypothetical protein
MTVPLQASLQFALALVTQSTRASSVTCQDSPGHTVTTCRIDRPIVTQRAFQYRAIRFRPGDVVTVEAGGCVGTGRSTGGWRRFVDPSGLDADRLFHGLIRIPGHPPGGGPVRIQSLVGRPLTIPTPLPPGNSFLSLGYEDGDYRDNGYDHHDDGPGAQCRLDRDGGPAWVSLTIRRNTATPAAGRAPLDLMSGELDPNGALLNPRFFWETSHDDHPNTSVLCDGFPYRSPRDESQGVRLGNPPCTTDMSGTDVAAGFNGVLCRASGAPDKLHGHVNWIPATVTGRIVWNGHSDWIHKGDDDYGFRLFPAHGGMLTSAQSAIDVEFDSDETIEHFDSAWWRTFKDAVDRDGGTAIENAGASSMVDDHEAVVTGLASLDAQHEATSQLHPVYAMALHISGNAADDRWAFFARNWGNQGFCSRDQHYWDVSPLSVFIPGPDGATGFQFLGEDVKANKTFGIRAAFLNGGVLLSFDLGSPESRAIVDGSVRIRWTMPPAPRAVAVEMGRSASSAFGPSIRAQLMTKPANGSRAEDLTLTAGLATDRIAQIRRQLARPVASKNTHSLQITRVPATTRLPSVSRTNVRTVLDSAKLERENRRANAVCAAQRANLPSLTAACAEARR